jgi:hypothetical protein
MNELDQAIVDYCAKFNLPCERSPRGWIINGTEFECVYWDNSEPVYVQGDRRVLYIANIAVQMSKLHEWLFRKPTAKIEKLDIETQVVDNTITINGIYNNELAVVSNFKIAKDYIFWLRSEYLSHYVPGWLSKSLRLVLRLDLGLPIECLTNAKDSSFERHLGFQVIKQTDCLEFAKEYGIDKVSYLHPETILMWRLKYDSFSTV